MVMETTAANEMQAEFPKKLFSRVIVPIGFSVLLLVSHGHDFYISADVSSEDCFDVDKFSIIKSQCVRIGCLDGRSLQSFQ